MAKRKTLNASSPVNFKQAASLALELLARNVDLLINMRNSADRWNESRTSRDVDTHVTMLTVADMIRALRANETIDGDAFDYELGKIASLVAVAKAAYSRENADYFLALSYTNAAFLVMMEMVELAAIEEDK
ncbi:hypothetical protein [Achromobacter insuavis]|uniref:hypothetical protein n=1 Tax=Achromobacter insuavis TaxID=1287735 RepID=UPI0029D9AE1B|nr:hypothetical protein [Achromobacter sp.]MCG2604115.1 hypothetical protein [Achromobacter sp.]